MKLIKSTVTLLAASLGAAIMATPASAIPVPAEAIASQDYNGQVNFSLSNGLSVVGTLDSKYRMPPGSPHPYQFNTSLSFGSISITPVITLTTPEIVIVPGQEICFFGSCYTTDDISLPAQVLPLTPSISLTDPISIYDLSYATGDIPLGQIFAFDFGTPVLGEALTVDDLVQAQFESGATSVSETGVVVGPLMGSYEYDGVLQPDGSTILADYTLDVTGPGVLAALEAELLALINENTDLLADLALEALLATDPCSAFGALASVCNDALAGLTGDDLGISVDSIGNFSADFSAQRSIVPVPVPATLPLLAVGLALVGLNASRRRKAA